MGDDLRHRPVPVGGSRTGLRIGSWVGSPNGKWVGAGTALCWRRQVRRVLKYMGECVIDIQNTVVQCIVTQPILDLYGETMRIPRTWSEKIGGNRRA